MVTYVQQGGDQPVRNMSFFCPQTQKRKTIYEEYVEQLPERIDKATQNSAQGQTKGVCLNHFSPVWHLHLPFVKTARKGSDFCDNCTKLQNSSTAVSNDAVKETLNIFKKPTRRLDSILRVSRKKTKL